MTKWPCCQPMGNHDEIQESYCSESKETFKIVKVSVVKDDEIQSAGSVFKKHRPRRLSRESKKESQESHCSESKEAFKIEDDIQMG
jgi:hypothetical protein